MGEDGPNDKQIHDRDMAWVLDADVIVAEVTKPSLGVGYAIGSAIEHVKPILALYRSQPDKLLSAMIAGSPTISCVKYINFEEAQKIIDNYFNNYLLAE